MAYEAQITQLDRIINEWGRDCTLIFPDGKTQCPNCIIDQDSKRSTNRYKAGGPQSFSDGELCPVCLGEGYVGFFGTENIKMNIVADPKRWMKYLPSNLNLSKHAILGRFFATDLPKVLKARRVVIQIDLAGYNKYEYFLAGEPFDSNHIIQGRYMACFWDRVGGL